MDYKILMKRQIKTILDICKIFNHHQADIIVDDNDTIDTVINKMITLSREDHIKYKPQDAMGNYISYDGSGFPVIRIGSVFRLSIRDVKDFNIIINHNDNFNYPEKIDSLIMLVATSLTNYYSAKVYIEFFEYWLENVTNINYLFKFTNGSIASALSDVIEILKGHINCDVTELIKTEFKYLEKTSEKMGDYINNILEIKARKILHPPVVVKSKIDLYRFVVVAIFRQLIDNNFILSEYVPPCIEGVDIIRIDDNYGIVQFRCGLINRPRFFYSPYVIEK